MVRSRVRRGLRQAAIRRQCYEKSPFPFYSPRFWLRLLPPAPATALRTRPQTQRSIRLFLLSRKAPPRRTQPLRQAKRSLSSFPQPAQQRALPKKSRRSKTRISMRSKRPKRIRTRISIGTTSPAAPQKNKTTKPRVRPSEANRFRSTATRKSISAIPSGGAKSRALWTPSWKVTISPASR